MKGIQSIWIVKTPVGLWAVNPPFWFMPSVRLAPLREINRPGLYAINDRQIEFVRSQTPQLNWLDNPKYTWEDIEIDPITQIDGIPIDRSWITFNDRTIITWNIYREYIVRKHGKIQYRYMDKEHRISMTDIDNDSLLGIVGMPKIKRWPGQSLSVRNIVTESY